MFPLQPKVCLFIQKQSSKENNIESNNQKENNIKASKKNNINLFMYKTKEKKKISHSWKSCNLGSQGVGRISDMNYLTMV